LTAKQHDAGEVAGHIEQRELEVLPRLPDQPAGRLEKVGRVATVPPGHDRHEGGGEGQGLGHLSRRGKYAGMTDKLKL